MIVDSTLFCCVEPTGFTCCCTFHWHLYVGDRAHCSSPGEVSEATLSGSSAVVDRVRQVDGGYLPSSAMHATGGAEEPFLHGKCPRPHRNGGILWTVLVFARTPDSFPIPPYRRPVSLSASKGYLFPPGFSAVTRRGMFEHHSEQMVDEGKKRRETKHDACARVQVPSAMAKRRTRGRAKKDEVEDPKEVDKGEKEKEDRVEGPRSQDEELAILAERIRSESGKDALVKALGKLAEMLEVAPQAKMSVRSAYLPCALALMEPGVFRHKDREVKLLLSTCLAHVMRLYAGVPDHPYNDFRISEVFGRFLWTFRLLDDAGGTSYPRALHVLEIVSRIKCCVLLLDFESQELTLDLMQVFFSSVNSENHANVAPLALDVLCDIVRACEGDIHQDMLDVILLAMIEGKKVEQHTFELALGVLRRCELELMGPVQAFLCSTIETGPIQNSELHHHYHDLILILYENCPAMLGNVLPALEVELTVDDEEKRASAVILLGKIFGLGEGDAVSEFPTLFGSFLDRFHDKRASIRQSMVDCAKGIALASEEGREEIVSSLEERLLDPEDKVRSSAVSALCDIICATPGEVSKSTMLQAAARLRDRRVLVRKEAMNKLAGVFSRLSTMEEEVFDKVVWIPSKILPLVFDEHIGLQIVENLLQKKLVSPKLQPEVVVEIWSKAYAHCEATATRALHDILHSKAALRTLFREYIKKRDELKIAAKESKNCLEAEMKGMTKAMSHFFPEKESALQHLTSIHALKDGHIMRGLETLARNDAVPEATSRAETDVLKRIGSQSQLYEFAKVLCARLICAPFRREHVTVLLDTIGDILENSAAPLADPYASFLLCLSKAFPALVSNSLPQLERILKTSERCHDVMVESMLRIIVFGGSSFQSDPTDQAKLQVLLSRICRTGTRQQAKYAVRALNALYGEDLRDIIASLGVAMHNALKATNTSMIRKKAALAAFANLCQYSPDGFESYLPAVLDIVGNILHERGKSAEAVSLKIEATKFLARICLPADTNDLQKAPPQEVSWRLADALATLTPLVEVDVDGTPKEASAEVRLAAAKALLRIARWRNAKIPAEAYRSIAYIALDPVADVRHGFAKRLFKGLRLFGLSTKFAATFAMFAVDVEPEFVNYAKTCLKSYIQSRRQIIQKAALAGKKLTVSSHPEFMLPFLLHVLAHHPDFPDRTVQHSDENGDAIADAIVPFQTILSFAIGSLLSTPSDGLEPGSSLPLVLAILRMLKVVEDPQSQKVSYAVWTLADIGLEIAKDIALKRHWDITRKFPGSVPMPNIFKPREGKRDPFASPATKRPSVEGSFLPEQLLPFSPGWKGFFSTTPSKRTKPVPASGNTPPANRDAMLHHGTSLESLTKKTRPPATASLVERDNVLKDAQQTSGEKDVGNDGLRTFSEQANSAKETRQSKRINSQSEGKENENSMPRRSRRRVCR